MASIKIPIISIIYWTLPSNRHVWWHLLCILYKMALYYTKYRPRPHFESLHPSSCDTSPSPTTPRPILWREMLTWPVEYFGPMEGMGKVFQRWGFFRSRNGESPNMTRILGSMWFEATTTTTVGFNHGKIYSWMGENKPTSNLGGYWQPRSHIHIFRAVRIWTLWSFISCCGTLLIFAQANSETAQISNNLVSPMP